MSFPKEGDCGYKPIEKNAFQSIGGSIAKGPFFLEEVYTLLVGGNHEQGLPLKAWSHTILMNLVLILRGGGGLVKMTRKGGYKNESYSIVTVYNGSHS